MLLNKILNQLENSKFTLIFISIFLFTLLIASIHFRQGGYLHPESQSFILNYLDKRPILQKVFAVQRNDWGFYQARELSYLFDIIDAYFIKFSIGSGFPHFYSLTYYLGIIIILYLISKIVRNFIKLNSPLIFMFLAGLFLTAPATFFSGIFFRTGKILSSVFITLIVYILLQHLISNPLKKQNKEKAKISLFLLLPLSILMSLSDRQGHFFLLATTCIFFALCFFEKSGLYKKIFLLFLGSTVLSLFYDYSVGPYLVKLLTGFRPDTIYMRPDFLTYTRQDPRWPISNLWLKLWSIAIDAFLFILDAFSYFFGNAPLLIIAIGLVFSFLVIIKTTKQKLYLIIFFAFFFILLMTFFMIIKQPQMVWPGIRRVYYALPLNLFILLFSAFVVSRLLYLWQKAKIPILLLLAGVFFFNIIALTTHYQKIKYSVESDQYKVYEYSPRLLQCLKDNQKSEAFFNLPAEIENVCKKLRN